MGAITLRSNRKPLELMPERQVERHESDGFGVETSKRSCKHAHKLTHTHAMRAKPAVSRLAPINKLATDLLVRLPARVNLDREFSLLLLLSLLLSLVLDMETR